MLDLFLIQIIVVIIIDLSGVVDHFKSFLKRILTKGRLSDPNYSFKPLDCSFCITFWTGLVYLLVTHSLSLWMMTWVLLLCVLTPVTGSFLVFVRELLLKVIRFLSNK